MAKKKRKLTAWQLHVKSYMASHPGLSFKEALPKAKLTYRKSSRAHKAPNPRPSKKARKVKRKMARKKRRVSRKMTIPLAPVIPIIAGFVGGTVYDPAGSPLKAMLDGDYQSAMNRLSVNFTGYNFDDGTWDLNRAGALKGTIIGLLIHKFVGGAPLNLNRILARHKIPFIRI